MNGLPTKASSESGSVIAEPEAVGGAGGASYSQKHDEAPSATATRSSIAVACVPCRSRHLKCDGAVRCSRCVSEDLSCVYLKSRRGWKGPRRTAKTSVPQSTGTSTFGSGLHHSSTTKAVPQLDLPPGSGVDAGAITKEVALTTAPLPSPPEDSLRLSFDAHTPPRQLVPVGPLTPPSITDASDQGLINAFYTYFHPTHPFVPPYHCLTVFDGWQVSHLELAMRFIGSLYIPSAKTKDYQFAIQQLIMQDALPTDGTKVQTLLLFAIGLHMSDFEPESAEMMRVVAKLACDLGMNRNEYAIRNGQGQPVLEECWRRTWWEVFVCDGFFTGVNPMHYQLVLRDVKQDVFLPCEEHEFHSGQIPPTYKTLDDYDYSVFDDNSDAYSSATYRIDAVRLMHKVCLVQRLQAENGHVDAEFVAQADVHLTNWWLHLPADKRSAVDKQSRVDEILFEAFMIAYACTIILHRPRSDLNADETKDVTTCIAAHQTPLPSAGQEIHTAKALRAAQDISALITLPCPLLKHTPFFSCAVVMASVVFLSYWSFILTPDDDSAVKEHIKLNIGVLKRQGEIWPIAQTVLGQVRGVARELFQSRKALLNIYLPAVTREDAFQSIIDESGSQLNDQHLFGSYITLDDSDDGGARALLGDFGLVV